MDPRYMSQVVERNNENSENRVPAHDAAEQGYINVMSYVTALRPSQTATHILSQADINNGYMQSQAAVHSPMSGRANWLSGMKTGYVGAAKQNFSYLSAAKEELLPNEYVTSFAEVSQLPQSRNSMESQQSIREAEETRLRQRYEEEVDAHNRKINELLHKNGFINCVAIKKGITASVAVFEYVGDDEEIMAITKHGFVMVKLPPYTAPFPVNNMIADNNPNAAEAVPLQTPLQLHAEMTYRNEFKIISEMKSISEHGHRPHVLAKVFEDVKVILNSPVFYNEDEFVKSYTAILNGEYLSLFSSSDSMDSEESDNEESADIAKRQAIHNLLLQSFINLNTRMRRLAGSREKPARVMFAIFASLKLAMNKLHNEGFAHSDLAGRNVVVKSNNSGVIVDLGAADSLNKINGNTINNFKLPQTSIMHDNAALKEDHIISVITDYVSFQKTILESVAYFMDVDFYKSIIENLPDAPRTVNIEFLLRFTDRQILDNVKTNLINAAKELEQRGDRRGKQALEIISTLEPYINHDHNPKHTLAELQAANDASFDSCVRSAYTLGPRQKTRERVSGYYDHVEAMQAAAPAREPQTRMTRANTADKITFFNSRARSGSHDGAAQAQAFRKNN